MTSNYESRKGAAIKFVGGFHAGNRGWVDKTKDATNEFIYVLVRQKNKEGWKRNHHQIESQA